MPVPGLSELVDLLLSGPHPISGIALVGSFARGNAGQWSDVDLLVFAQRLPQRPEPESLIQPPGQLRVLERHGHLVTIAATTFDIARAGMKNPRLAIRTVPGLRTAVILDDDREGSLAELKGQALSFAWEPLRDEARALSARMVTDLAEETCKLRAALESGNRVALSYPSVGLLLGLTEAVAVSLGVMVESDNRYYEQVQTAAGEDSKWSRLHRVAAGLEKSGDLSLAETSARACLELYVETVRLLEDAFQPDQRTVVALGLRAARITPHPPAAFSDGRKR